MFNQALAILSSQAPAGVAAAEVEQERATVGQWLDELRERLASGFSTIGRGRRGCRIPHGARHAAGWPKRYESITATMTRRS